MRGLPGAWARRPVAALVREHPGARRAGTGDRVVPARLWWFPAASRSRRSRTRSPSCVGSSACPGGVSGPLAGRAAGDAVRHPASQPARAIVLVARTVDTRTVDIFADTLGGRHL